jgi:hypothetical protein
MECAGEHTEDTYPHLQLSDQFWEELSKSWELKEEEDSGVIR